MTPPVPVRARVDACPGALQTHPAADGELARVRVPGGVLTRHQLGVLGQAARDLGDGALELTSRGNVQLRGLAAGAETDLGDRLAAAGLLPSDTHERVRNVLASTLSGRGPDGHVDVRPWVAEFDAGLCGDPELAALPGRFLVTLDDGRGDVAGLGGDVGLLALGPDAIALTLGGADTGARVAPHEAVPFVLASTRAFAAERATQGSTAWRLTDLEDGADRVAARLPSHRRVEPLPLPAPPHAGPVGAVAQTDGRTALVALVPLGRLTADQADLLAGLAAEVQLTPWRSIAVPDLPDASAASVLTGAGLVLDPLSPWRQVSACAGLPGCAKSLADVRADAVAAVASATLPAGGARQHWAGCARRCGRPRGQVVDVVATPTGYRVEKS